MTLVYTASLYDTIIGISLERDLDEGVRFFEGNGGIRSCLELMVHPTRNHISLNFPPPLSFFRERELYLNSRSCSGHGVNMAWVPNRD